MTRAHLYRPIQDNLGNLRVGAVVTVLDPTTRQSIIEPMYTSDTAMTALPNPFTANSGVIDFYLDVPRRVLLSIRVGNETPFEVTLDVQLPVDIPPPHDHPHTHPKQLSTEFFQIPGNVPLASNTTQTFAWTTVPAFKRAMVWRMVIEASATNTWSVRVTSRPTGAGEVMFEAVGIGQTRYEISWPWMFSNDDLASEFYIGIYNGGGESIFTLTDLRAEVFVP